jgi:hypothetical protein
MGEKVITPKKKDSAKNLAKFGNKIPTKKRKEIFHKMEKKKT